MAAQGSQSLGSPRILLKTLMSPWRPSRSPSSPTEDPPASASLSFGPHYALTAATQAGAVLLAGIVVPILAHRWSGADFGRYQVAYRALALLQPSLTLGMSVALTRSLAKTDGSKPERQLAAAAIPVALTLSAVTILVTLFDEQASELLFGQSGRVGTVHAALALLWGSSVYVIGSSYLSGRFLFLRANILFLLYMGLIPLTAAILLPSPNSVLWFTAAGWVVATLLLVVSRPDRPASSDRTSTLSSSRELLRYGVRRIPGELSLFGLLNLPPIIAVHNSGIRTAGYVGVAMSLITLAGTLSSPLSTVLLPYASREGLRLTSSVRRILSLNAAALLGFTLVAFGAAPLIARYLLNAPDTTATVIRITSLAFIPYGGFVAVRGYVDARALAPVTMHATVWALGIFIAAALVLASLGVVHGTLFAMVLAMWLLFSRCLVLATRLWRVSKAGT